MGVSRSALNRARLEMALSLCTDPSPSLTWKTPAADPGRRSSQVKGVVRPRRTSWTGNWRQTRRSALPRPTMGPTTPIRFRNDCPHRGRSRRMTKIRTDARMGADRPALPCQCCARVCDRPGRAKPGRARPGRAAESPGESKARGRTHIGIFGLHVRAEGRWPETDAILAPTRSASSVDKPWKKPYHYISMIYEAKLIGAS